MSEALENLRQNQRGITGLETAIILIAFVVVASVFAFTILSSGVFAAERTKQTVFAGLQDTRSSVEARGGARAFRGFVGDSQAVYKVSFMVANAVNGESVDLTPAYTVDDSGLDPDVSPGAEYVTVISYQDADQFFPDVPWTVQFIGSNNGDNVLDFGEKAQITVWLLDRDNSVPLSATGSLAYMNDSTADGGGTGAIGSDDILLTPNDHFTLEVKPPRGAVLTLERTLPPSLTTVMDLR